MNRLQQHLARWSLAACLGFFAVPKDNLKAGEKEDLLAAFGSAQKLEARDNYPAAAVQYELALSLAPRVFGADSEKTATILNKLAILYAEMSRYAKAESLFQRSLKIREDKLGPGHPDVATSLTNLANLFDIMGQYSRAEPLYQRALKIREARLGPDHIAVADSFGNLALLYRHIGDYTKAETLFQRSISIHEAKLGPDHSDLATSLANLAILYADMGQYAKAEPLIQRSLRIHEAELGPNHPSVAMSLQSLAELYRDMGQWSKAEPLYQRSLKIRAAKLGPDHPDVAASLNNLAAMYAEMGQWTKAEPLFQRSLRIYEAQLGPDHRDVATSLQNLATLYMDMGQHAKAELLYQRSLKIREAKLGPDHPDVATNLNSLALLYKYMCQNDKAESLHLRSLKIREAKLGPGHPDVAQSANNLAWLNNSMGRIDQAASWCDRMRRITRRHVAEVLPVLSEREQLTFIERGDEARFHGALSFGQLHRDEPALAQQSAGWLINGKAVVLESLAERALLARDSADPALADRIKKLLGLRTELAGQSLATPKPGQESDHRRKLTELSGQEQELTRQVYLAVGRSAQENPWIEAAAVRGALTADAVLVDIARFRQYIFESKWNDSHWQPARYVAWVIPSADQGNVEIVDLGAADEIDQAIEAARQAIEHSAAKVTKADEEEAAARAALIPLSKLAALVLEPLKTHLVGIKQLVLSPDSNLWLVPWAALPVQEGKYAIEEWQIRYVTSGRDLVAEQLIGKSSQREQSRPRVFADPDFNLDGKQTLAATRAVLRGKETQLALRSTMAGSASGLPKVDRLPATADEARLITAALESYAHEVPTVYSEQYALEGVLKVVHSPRVLVLSTHGFYLPDQEVELENVRGRPGGIEADKSPGALLTTDGKSLENPLLRCGLLLAGCNKPPTSGVDDGVVTGMEIVGCDLRDTDMVVLSACQTGLGQVRNGEGVAGLRQAFQLAGAKAVVSTLWRIPDTETATLMTDFFGDLAAGQTKAEALRSAQLARIKARRHEAGAAHPLYWAAFTLTGN